jgi:hypothetical protein
MTPPTLLFRRRMPAQTPAMPVLSLAGMATVVRATVILAALAATLSVHAAEPALPTADVVPDAPAKPAVPSDDPAVQARLPGCAVWTDRCVTCEREAGRISCSNIGIACQPQAVECVRNEPPEERKQGN